MFGDLEYLTTETGAVLAFRRHAAIGSPRGIVLICHGITEHSDRYGELAACLAQFGFHVYAHDHRGHGHTWACDAPLGRFAWRHGEDAVVRDFLSMRDAAVARHPDLPVVIIGHSLGSIISLRFAELFPDKLNALVLSGVNIHMGLLARLGQGLLLVEQMLKGSDVPSRVGARLALDVWADSVDNAETPYDWLSFNRENVATYLADPLCGQAISVSLWRDVLALGYRTRPRSELRKLRLTLPVHLVGGDQDPVTHNGKMLRWLEKRLAAAGMRNVTLRIWPSMRHEIFQEMGRNDVNDSIGRWCRSVVDP